MLSFREQLRLAGQNAALARSLSPFPPLRSGCCGSMLAREMLHVAFFPVLYCDKVVHL